jgi:hypothetical protein
MGKLLLVVVAVVLVVIVGGLVFLTFWDIPAPQAHSEHVIPDAKLPK